MPSIKPIYRIYEFLYYINVINFFLFFQNEGARKAKLNKLN